MQAAAFQDRQCESAIWLHQIGLDNKPPEYKGSTGLFHYFFLFPKAACQSCWRFYTVSLSLSHMSFHPVHFGSVGIPMWQLVSCIRSHACSVTGGTLTHSCVCTHAHPCTSVGLFFTLSHLSLHMSDSHRHRGFKTRAHLCGEWSVCKSVLQSA